MGQRPPVAAFGSSFVEPPLLFVVAVVVFVVLHDWVFVLVGTAVVAESAVDSVSEVVGAVDSVFVASSSVAVVAFASVAVSAFLLLLLLSLKLHLLLLLLLKMHLLLLLKNLLLLMNCPLLVILHGCLLMLLMIWKRHSWPALHHHLLLLLLLLLLEYLRIDHVVHLLRVEFGWFRSSVSHNVGIGVRPLSHGHVLRWR